MYKICSKCKETKSLLNFNKNKSQKDGYNNQCNDCLKIYREKTRQHRIDYLRRWRENNPDARKIHYQNNKERSSVYAKQYRELNGPRLRKNTVRWQKENLDKDAAKTARRRAAKLKAIPPWITKEQLREIKELYTCAQMFKLYTGQEYHVDHIVPLQGENVCGLHVPWNLQVITAQENLSKSNKLIQE